MRNARRWGCLAALALATAAWTAAPAQAGTYNVYSCSIDGGFFGNGAWATALNPAGVAGSADTTCASPGDPLGGSFAPQGVFAPGSFAGVGFTAPSGTYISDYSLVVRQVWYAPGNAADGSQDEHTYNLVNLIGDGLNRAVSGGGRWHAEDRAALVSEGHWYSYQYPAYPASRDVSFNTGVITVNRNASGWGQTVVHPVFIGVSVGCGDAATEPAGCTLGRSGNPANVAVELYGSRVTIKDDSDPALDGPPAGQGLRAPGTRSGSEPVVFSASDNVGIRRAELVDVTDASTPRVAAAKDFNAVPTAQKTRCNFTEPLPCPNLTKESLTANPPIAGHRTLLVRVTDSAGNQTVSEPFAVYARGSANGVNAGDGARLIAGFPAKVYRRSKAGKRYYTYVLRPSRTVSYGKTAAIRGTLRNADGQPIVGADVRVLVRENRTGAQYVDRGGITTDDSGRLSLGVPAGSSRSYQLTYKAYVGDDDLAARSKAAFNTRARITVRASRHVRSRGVARFRGTLVGRPRPRRGVTLELQAYQPHRGWRTVATVRTGKNGRYGVRYRFNSGRGSFRFRVRLRPNDAYPYARGSSKRVRVRVG